MPIRFLHVADLHLGMRITRFDENACSRIGEARFWAIDHLRAKAAEHRVDFVVIAGDLFDDHSVSTVKVAERAFRLFEGKEMPCPVYVIPGNHDPLTPGGVWDRPPWRREQPTRNIHLLRERAPVAVPDLPVVLFPCPLRHRNSIDDPTAWIAGHPPEDGSRTFRIGVAHGSLKIMPNLPEDDHLIRADAADHCRLDYLALGHWHKPLRYPSADRAERTAYSGTHEPMRFPDADAGLSTGWRSYSADSKDGNAERFQDGGVGTALLVTLDQPGAPPQIETLEIGKLRWLVEKRDLTSQPIGDIISEFAHKKENHENTVLRLKLSGVLDPQKFASIENFRDIIQGRFHAGSSLDADDVLIEPTPEQLAQTVGVGVLARVLGRLREDAQTTDPAVKKIAGHALKLLYRIAWEEQLP